VSTNLAVEAASRKKEQSRKKELTRKLESSNKGDSTDRAKPIEDEDTNILADLDRIINNLEL